MLQQQDKRTRRRRIRRIIRKRPHYPCCSWLVFLVVQLNLVSYYCVQPTIIVEQRATTTATTTTLPTNHNYNNNYNREHNNKQRRFDIDQLVNHNNSKSIINDTTYTTTNRRRRRRRTRSITSYKNKESKNDGIYQKCGFTSSVRFSTWFRSLYTDSPVLFPTNDTELITLVTTAAAAGCKIRVRGAGHSEDGIVMQKSDAITMNVIVLNLKKYIPDDPMWHKVILLLNNNSISQQQQPVVRMSAGSSQIELLRYVRPQGYLTATGTIGRLFNLGGVYMNPSTFGGWFNENRLAYHVTAVRVLHANGTIHVYSGDDVIPYRGSMGLLGIITALEIQLRNDTGLLMARYTFDYGTTNAPYTTSKVYNNIQQVTTGADGCHYFYFSRIDTLLVQVFNYTGNPTYNFSATQVWYDAQPQYYTNQKEYNNPTLQLYATTVGKSNLAGKIDHLRRVKLLNNEFDARKVTPNDGYTLYTNIPSFEQVSYFIHCTSYRCINESTILINVTRNFLQQHVYTNVNSRFADSWLFWRVFQIKDIDVGRMTLEHLTEPGYYIGAEVQTARLFTPDYRANYTYYFYQIEQLWRTTFPSVYNNNHHGKAYAYGKVTVANSNEYIPFQNDNVLNSIYTDNVKTKFITLMNQLDPQGVFRAGSVLRMLGLSSDKYSIQQYNGDTCYYPNVDATCYSSCCTRQPPSTGFRIGFRSSSTPYICEPRMNQTVYTECRTDCDCSTGMKCQSSLFSIYRNTCIPQ